MDDRSDMKKDWRTLPSWSEEFCAATIERFEAFQKRLKTSKRHHRIQRMWRKVYMRDRHGHADTTEIGAAGRKGETLLIASNRIGRLVRDHVTLVQQTPSNPEPMAANSDVDCQAQVALARGIIEHYKRESDLEGIKAWRATVAEICGDSYLHVPWDQDLGRDVAVEDIDPDAAQEESEPIATAMPTGQVVAGIGESSASDAEENTEKKQRIVYEGDYKFCVRSPYEIAYDRSSPEPKKPRWWIVKEPMNRWDLIAQINEETSDEAQRAKLVDSVMNAERWTEELRKLDYDNEQDEYDDTIAVFYVYCEVSRGIAEGRKAIVIDKKNLLIDGPLGEPRCPVFRLSQGEVLFRSEATTQNHDGLPLIDAIDGMLSTILSNAANQGMQRVAVDRRSNVDVTALDAGAGQVNYDGWDERSQQSVPPPTVMQLWAGDGSLIQDWELFTAELDLVVGGSPVTRGDPKATKGDSGSKVAALFAAAQSVGSSFVAACLRSDQELFTYLISSLAIHATMPRLISIVGKHNSFAAKEYTGDQLKKIVRVMVTQADAMRDTLAGRMATVELIQNQTPEQQKQTIAVLSTGRIEPITDPEERPRLLLERENEALIDPAQPMPIMLPNDPHAEHWKSHMDQLNDPGVRRDQAVVQRILHHSQQHEMALTPGNPSYAGDGALHLTGQNPLPAPAPPPAAPSQSAGPNAGPPGPNDQPPPGSGGGHGPGEGVGPPGMPNRPRMPTNPIDHQPMAGNGGAPGAPVGAGMAM